MLIIPIKQTIFINNFNFDEKFSINLKSYKKKNKITSNFKKNQN